ncbi:hypothetical protein HJG60_011157 [Phyllostomus discolor]|uniref:Uncharacterized protein n=1 Tax=Phyllostomus discolor TaxID=89673 RepID=A0A834E1D7_9CHIR|nr:hypothetical protein HJG60_011157 [Phyllostomus discolor]
MWCLPTLLPQGCDCHGQCSLQMSPCLVVISGLNLIHRGSPTNPGTLRGSETGLQFFERDEEQGDAEGLKDQGTTQAGVSGRRVSRGPPTGQPGPAGDPAGHRGRGGYEGGAAMGALHCAFAAPCVWWSLKVIRVPFYKTLFLNELTWQK